jgi:hypothetical protein
MWLKQKSAKIFRTPCFSFDSILDSNFCWYKCEVSKPCLCVFKKSSAFEVHILLVGWGELACCFVSLLCVLHVSVYCTHVAISRLLLLVCMIYCGADTVVKLLFVRPLVRLLPPTAIQGTRFCRSIMRTSWSLLYCCTDPSQLLLAQDRQRCLDLYHVMRFVSMQQEINAEANWAYATATCAGATV